jgi:hypothetical protein
MKSTEVYKEINKIIYPKLKTNGFKKTKSGMLGFYKLLKEYYLVIWFQCSKDGFDLYAGSKFIVEIQISKSNEIGVASIIRHRIPYFLTEKEFDIIAKIENEIKDKLQKPPKTHYIFSLAENIQKWYRGKFEKVNNTYNNSSDIWFVYFDHTDIEKWIEIIKPMIDRIIYDFERTDY